MPLNTEVIAKLDSDRVISETDSWLTLSAGDFNEGGVQKYMQLSIYRDITAKFPFLNEDAKRVMTERLYGSAVTKLYENAQGIEIPADPPPTLSEDERLIDAYPYLPELVKIDNNDPNAVKYVKGYRSKSDDAAVPAQGTPPDWTDLVTGAQYIGWPDFMSGHGVTGTFGVTITGISGHPLRFFTWPRVDGDIAIVPPFPDDAESGDSDTSQTIDLSISLDQLSSELGNLQNTLPSIPGGNNVGGNITEYGDDRITNVTNVTNVVNNVTSVTNVVNVVDGAADAATSPSVLGSSAGTNAPQAPGFGDADFSGLGGSLNRDW